MPAHTFPIVDHLIAHPNLPDPLHEWYWWGPIRLYASIECYGAGGEKLTIYYLRPDNIYPYEAGGPQNTYDPSKQQASIYKYAWEYRNDCHMLTGSNPVYASLETTYPSAMRIYSEFPLLAATTASVPDVVGWLNQHPDIANKLWWAEPGDSAKRFPDWLQQRKGDLAAAFARAWNYETIPWNDTPPDQTATHDSGGDPLLNVDDAWTIYAAYLGHMLAVEIGGRVPWSILSYSADQLLELFSIFNYMPNGYQLQTWIIPASPHFTYSFLVNNIIGATRLKTITNLLDWCRNFMMHFLDGDIIDTWGYYWPPVKRIIEGTIYTKHPEMGVQCYTAGCAGTTRFLETVLKVVNIPVQRASADGHATPYFMTEDAYLSHGDDPYNMLMKAAHPFLFKPIHAVDDPIDQLLIDAATYNAWFGPTVPEPDQETNVGRRPAELATQYFPDYLLHAYWLDKQANLTPPQGKVYRILGSYFPLSTITALWAPMEKRLFALGGLFWRARKPGQIIPKPPKPPKP